MGFELMMDEVRWAWMGDKEFGDNMEYSYRYRYRYRYRYT